MTAHKLLYRSRLKSNGKYIREPRVTLENSKLKLIVVDEISMLPKEMWYLLLAHNIPIICCGDPEQLPPINPDTDNHVLDKPHVFLDEIMRQAAESEVIRLSMHVRQGGSLDTFDCQQEQVQIFDKHNVVDGMYTWADQIICATNEKRKLVNTKVRSLLGFGPTPQSEDKIISLHNHWDDVSKNDIPITNGTIGNISDMRIEKTPIPKFISSKPIDVLWCTLTGEDGEIYQNIPLDYQLLLKGKPQVTPRMAYQMKTTKLACINPPLEFVYGYGITCHKAQGSEWDNILIFEQDFPFGKEEHRRWLYTAITRASEKVVIIKK